MKTVLAAVAAAVLSGGGAVAVVASGLVPMPQTTARTERPVLSDADEGGLEQENADLRDEVAGLKNELKKLSATLASRTDGLDAKLKDKADKTALETKADRKDLEAAKAEIAARPVSADGAAAPAPAVTGEFKAQADEWWAQQQAKMQEERRLERQAAREAQLVESKERIAEIVPNFVKGQQQRLNLTDAQVTEVGNILVTHMTKRAELASANEALRIDNKEVDRDATRKANEDLDAATLASLTAQVDQATAEGLLKGLNRLGNAGGNDRNRGTQGRAR